MNRPAFPHRSPPRGQPTARLSGARYLRLGLLLLACTLTLAVPAFGDLWFKHYDQAEKALAAEEWEAAVEQLYQAIERRGESAVRARTYGMKTTAYFPYLKLGIALYQLGELDAALQAFETEERLGEIAKSESHLGELRTHQDLARRAQGATADQERQRIRQIVEQSLREARSLRDSGLPDEALKALGRGQSIAPDDPEVLAALASLRQEVARRQEDRDRAEQAARWVAEGRVALVAGELGAASTAFRRALELESSAEIEALYDETQERLRAELRHERDDAESTALVAGQLAEARELTAAGNHAAALERLQSVLAVEPRNQPALNLQTRLLEAQAQAALQSTRQDQIRDLLADADNHLGAERPEEALAAINHVLALDPGNTAALDLAGSAYREISLEFLGSAARQNLPPAISFADLRQELEDGSRVERVESPDFRLSGLVIDDEPVAIVLSDRDGREIPAEQWSSTGQALDEIYLTNFSLAARLKPGASLFRVVATDSEGLSRTSEYAVAYDPPLYRRPQLHAAAAATVLALAGAFVWRRVQRRRRLRRRRFNPYVAGAPVLDEDLFFGREALIDRILQTVHNNSLLLHGERRIGKTTLQHHLKRRLQGLDDPDYDFYPVYIDLQGTPQERFFATLAEDVCEDLAPILGGLEPSPPADGDYGYHDLVRDFRSVLKILKAQSSKRVKLVLLIDEVDELNDYDPKINQRLRSLFMKSFAENLVAVVSGVAIKKHWEREGSPWYNFFEEIEIKGFGRDDAEKLIERPIRGLFKLEEGLVDHVIALTGGKPYLIQKLLLALVQRLHEEGRRRITIADVDAVGRPEEV